MKGWKWLTDSIPTGRREAVSMEHLARINGLSRREMRFTIEKARRAGILICGDESGYYFAESPEESRAYIQRVQRRIRTAKACLVPFLREQSESGGGLS